MKRLFVLAALCVGALMLVGEAPATTRDTDTQELLVVPFNTAPGAQTDTDIEVYVPPTDAATAKVSIYAPTGYGVNTSLAPGTKIGDIEGAVNIKQLGTNVDVTGTLTTDDPAKYATDPNAQACAPGTHAAVWVASIGASGSALERAVE